jgi:hypothetical protein
LESGFASLSQFKLCGTVAVSDVAVFWTMMPTNEEVNRDVTAYYTRKEYFAYGLQVQSLMIYYFTLHLVIFHFTFPFFYILIIV